MGGLTNYVIRRLLLVIPLLLGLSMIIFLLIHLAPGDPTTYFIPEEGLDTAARERIARHLGLDQPLHIQYYRWLVRAVQGDFGQSFGYGRPVVQVVMQRLPATLELQVAAISLSLILAIPIGVVSALKKYSTLDHGVTSFAFLGLSMPEFWFALMLMLLFSVHLGLTPVTGAGVGMPGLHRIPYFILPTVVLGLRTLAWYARFMRSSMLDVIRQDYITTARAKGLSQRVVVYKHALKNAMLPMVTIVGMSLPRLIGGAVIVESIFAWPGIGRLMYDAVLRRDYPVLMALTTFTGAFVLVLNVVVDIIYAFLDPRISYT